MTMRAIAPALFSRPATADAAAAHVLAHGNPEPAEAELRAPPGTGSAPAAREPPPRRPSARGRAAATSSGKTAASPETAPAAPRSSPRRTSDSAPTKTSSPSIRYGSTVLERLVRDLQPREVRRQLAQALDRGGRNRVAGPRAELVEVERERRARLGRRGEVRDDRLLVERVVRRPDHRDGVGADLRRVRGQRDRVGRGLRAAVDGDLEAVSGGARRRAPPPAAAPRAAAGSPRRSSRARGSRRALPRPGTRRTARTRPRRAPLPPRGEA